jgi:N,N'-diacetylchitobiose phosphorylase
LIRPCIPADWPGFRLSYRLPDGETQCEIIVDNPRGGRRVIAARLDGREVTLTAGTARITLPEAGGQYRIEVRLG